VATLGKSGIKISPASVSRLRSELKTQNAKVAGEIS